MQLVTLIHLSRYIWDTTGHYLYNQYNASETRTYLYKKKEAEFIRINHVFLNRIFDEIRDLKKKEEERENL